MMFSAGDNVFMLGGVALSEVGNGGNDDCEGTRLKNFSSSFRNVAGCDFVFDMFDQKDV